MPPVRDEDPPELRRRLLGSPAVVAEHAMRLAWETSVDVSLLNQQLQRTSGAVTDLEAQIIKSLYRIEQRLGIVERKPSRPEMPAVVITSSDRPISYHDLPEAIAEVERKQVVAWWMALIDGMKGVFRDGIKKGAAGAVAVLVISGALLAAGYFIRDCTHALVKTGTSNTMPKFHGAE